MTKDLRGSARALWLRVRTSLNARLGSYRRSPSTYWDLRHQRLGESLDGVGQIGLGHDANEQDYEEKWRHISDALDAAGVSAGQRVLDAGCGIGWVSERLVGRGLDLTAVDFSPEATRLAAKRLGSDVSVHAQSLHEPVPGQPFDAVVCIDVLFHIVDDDLWAATVANLAAMVTPAGTLVIQENLADPTHTAGSAEHVRWRSLDRYRAGLPEWNVVQIDSYELPAAGTTKDLLVWQRRSAPATE